MDKRRK